MSSSLFTRLQSIFSKSPNHFSTAAAAFSTTTASTVAASTTASGSSTSAADFSTSAADSSTTTDAASEYAASADSTATAAATSTTPPVSMSSEIQGLVKKFKRDSRIPNFRSRLSRYDSMVRLLAAGKFYSAIEDILEHQKKYPDMAVEGFGVRLISLYGKAEMFDHAYKVFDEMPEFNSPRTVLSFNALLSACVNSKNFDEVEELFRELPEKLEIKPDVVSYNTVIKGFCESGDFESALKMMEEMEGSEVPPDVVSYNTVMEAYSRENKLAEAEELWRMMEEKGVIPGVRTYNTKLRWLVKNEQVEEALELVEKMENEKLNPDKFMYNVVIRGCIDKGKLEEAKMLYKKMAGNGRRLPDDKTCAMLISFACEKDDTNFAFEVCKHTVDANVTIRRSKMKLVVDALIKGSKITEANQLVKLVNSSKKHGYTLPLPVTT